MVDPRSQTLLARAVTARGGRPHAESEALGEAHPDTGITHVGVALCLRAQGQLAEALPLGRAGVPLYLWYEPGQPPEELPQVLTAGMLVERVRSFETRLRQAQPLLRTNGMSPFVLRRH